MKLKITTAPLRINVRLTLQRAIKAGCRSRAESSRVKTFTLGINNARTRV